MADKDKEMIKIIFSKNEERGMIRASLYNNEKNEKENISIFIKNGNIFDNDENEPFVIEEVVPIPFKNRNTNSECRHFIIIGDNGVITANEAYCNETLEQMAARMFVENHRSVKGSSHLIMIQIKDSYYHIPEIRFDSTDYHSGYPAILSMTVKD